MKTQKQQRFFLARKFLKSSKKSQLYGQIFIYILTILVISFILVYGYNSVQNFRKRTEQVSCLKFKNDLSNAVEAIMSDFGSIKKKDLQMCAGYTQVCFVETFNQIDMGNIRTNEPIDPIIIDSISSDIGRNSFFVDRLAKESFYAGNISIDPDVLCIKAINNKISLRLEGKGNHVDLSEWK